MALTLATILPMVLNVAVNLVEGIIKGKGQSDVKKTVGVDVTYDVLTKLAQLGIIPAVPPKDELGGLVDGAVAIKNAEGWNKAAAVNNIIMDGAMLAQFFITAFQAGKADKPTG